jgi:UDP-2,3-diacylglucosamine hydrolase
MTLEAVFISDLHLHEDAIDITERFYSFTDWAAHHTRAVYILGDFLHVWPGDDAFDNWSRSIAARLAWLVDQGIEVYFMPGNRDFLLGNQFYSLAKTHPLDDPTIIELQGQRILLVHGDRYCTQDTSHQWLRRLTRNSIFHWIFLHLPYQWRSRIVYSVRQHSQLNIHKSIGKMGIVAKTMLTHMDRMHVNVVIHGHIHKAGLTVHQSHNRSYQQFVLSDWDDKPSLLCYDKANGFYFELLECLNYGEKKSKA